MKSSIVSEQVNITVLHMKRKVIYENQKQESALRIKSVVFFSSLTSSLTHVISCWILLGISRHIRHNQKPMGSSFAIPTHLSWNHVMQAEHLVISYFVLDLGFTLHESQHLNVFLELPLLVFDLSAATAICYRTVMLLSSCCIDSLSSVPAVRVSKTETSESLSTVWSSSFFSSTLLSPWSTTTSL